MDIRRALTHVFHDPDWPTRLGPAALIACVPVIGPLYLSSYALRALRCIVTDRDDRRLPRWRWDRQALVIGLKCQVLAVLCGLVAGLLGIVLWELSGETPDESATGTALTFALRGPSHLVTMTVFAVLLSACLARFAATGSAWAALDPGKLFAHLRAEPAIWMGVAVVGFLIEEAPVTLVWLAPLPAQLDAVARLAVTALLWPYAQLVQAHLIGQAYRWSARSVALRQVTMRYRW
jgi:hypothetical protein